MRIDFKHPEREVTRHKERNHADVQDLIKLDYADVDSFLASNFGGTAKQRKVLGQIVRGLVHLLKEAEDACVNSR